MITKEIEGQRYKLSVDHNRCRVRVTDQDILAGITTKNISAGIISKATYVEQTDTWLLNIPGINYFGTPIECLPNLQFEPCAF